MFGTSPTVVLCGIAFQNTILWQSAATEIPLSVADTREMLYQLSVPITGEYSPSGAHSVTVHPMGQRRGASHECGGRSQ